MRTFMVLVVSIFLCFSLKAQTNEQIQKKAMQQLDWLQGEWVGTTAVNMSGKNSVVSMKETVIPSLDGTILKITGVGMEKDSVVHDALAVISFDVEQQKYRWNAWRIPGGTYAAYEITVGKQSFEWSTKVKGGQTRYKAALNEKGQWIEIGEFSSDGTKWYKFMTMTLDKKK